MKYYSGTTESGRNLWISPGPTSCLKQDQPPSISAQGLSCSGLPKSSLHWGSLDLTQLTRCGLTTAGKRGEIPFLYLVSSPSLSSSFLCYFHFHVTPRAGNESLPCAALLRTRKGQELALEFTLQNLMLEYPWECIQPVFFRSLHEIMRCCLQKSSSYLV